MAEILKENFTIIFFIYYYILKNKFFRISLEYYLKRGIFNFY